ncbi:helix-turn-helix domain-containing protein [Kaistia nematophila]|uniref:Helix-turn-helix transcriptional regulator n=1 Tax=Kaistia nematophila TaxID=2994654 RepID=A0A9X3EE86_9HYPH|nr:helix-turn-helix transcriptional regulator [Kaistia nematophila]MCX5571465.1 helix-turn-helix transcriptional regulator [Kaistia nematophila]
MGKPHFISDEIVVLSRRDYDALMARSGDEAAEDRMTAAIIADSDAAIAAGADIALPESVWAAIEAGDTPVRAIRKHRGMTQAGLAAAAGVTQGYIADIETGKKAGSTETLKAIARALAVPLDTLVD